MVNIFLSLFCLYGGLFFNLKQLCEREEFINISDYDYPRPEEEGNLYRIAILGTNDIHGAAFSQEITHPITKEVYKYGGLEYLATYVRILREEWKERFLWLDAGDQFQGAIESKISNGSIITDFFNALKVNSSAIGNHEWDYGQPYLFERLKAASWGYLAANIYNTTTNQTNFLPDTKSLKLFQVGEVKIGVIGLATVETPFTTSGDLTEIGFWNYRDIVIKSAEFLRKQGANAVVLNTHVGMRCPNQQNLKMILKIWKETTRQVDCEDDAEMKVLLNSLDPGLVDAVVAGHVHDVAHHWVNGVPLIQNINGGYYSHVLYLTFDKATKKVVRDKIRIEGPLPTCEKIFENTKKCEYLTEDIATVSGGLKPFVFHDKSMKGDTSTEVLFQKWWEQVKPYKVTIGYTEGLLTKDKTKENTLGNLIADSYRFRAKADIAVVNGGSLRSTWYPGNILVETVYNMFPFDNYIVSFEMTGAQVKHMLAVLQAGMEGFYHTSGLMQQVQSSPEHKLISVKMYDGSDIDDTKTYIIATNDFCAGGGDDFKDVVSWYALRNFIKISLVRDEAINYIKQIRHIAVNDFIDPKKPRLEIVNSNSKQKNLKGKDIQI